MWAFQNEDAQSLRAVPAPPPLRSKSGVIITEDSEGGVTIEFDKFTLTIKPK